MSTPVVPVAQQDFLDQDPPLRGQKYTCVSFVSPEDVIMRKDAFEFFKFMQAIRGDVDQLLTALNDKYADAPEAGFVADMISGIRERHEYLYSAESMKQELDSFVAANADKINQEFGEQVGFQTSIRGFKIRGTFDTLVEARSRAEKIRSFDKNFNVYVAEVGCWCPWSPNPDEIADNEYAESHLNTLMKKYKDNEAQRAEFYERRKDRFVEKAIKEADEIKEANGVPEVATGIEEVTGVPEVSEVAGVSEVVEITETKEVETYGDTTDVTNAQNQVEQGEAMDSLKDVFETPDPWMAAKRCEVS